MSHYIIAFGEGEGVKKHFSIRIENELLSRIDRIAAEEDRSRGAVVRRIIQQFFSKEESHENKNRRKNDRPGNDAGFGGGL
ncbi:ribbon-helix-helix domain-containing protein [Leptospirillum sp. Group II 'CF-1']|jgi:metal-responsive CopG/Arc/MetJ family transcriptional regulator|uniref:CopG family ribbon-helix-helix protein n=1 Tax=Leptospirillum sp. Group II 'CF-1' TaxID=1660083 RepID=UPI00030A3AFD